MNLNQKILSKRNVEDLYNEADKLLIQHDGIAIINKYDILNKNTKKEKCDFNAFVKDIVRDDVKKVNNNVDLNS